MKELLLFEVGVQPQESVALLSPWSLRSIIRILRLLRIQCENPWSGLHQSLSKEVPQLFGTCDKDPNIIS